jgi:RNA polymerase sigma-70 factor (ECF subfamily)
MADSVGQERFTALRPFLSSGQDVGYAEVGRTLGIGETAVRVAVHRMRRRFGELMREEIAETVSSAAEVDDELRELQRILRR